MKVCLLLCLTLPHVIVGSIFQQQGRVDLDSIDNYDYKPSPAQYTIQGAQAQAVDGNIAAQIPKYAAGELDFNSPQTIQELIDLHQPRNKNLSYEHLDAKNQETVLKLIAYRQQRKQQQPRYFVEQERSQEYQQDQPQYADKSQEQYYPQRNSQENVNQQYIRRKRNNQGQKKHQYSEEQSNSQEPEIPETVHQQPGVW